MKRQYISELAEGLRVDMVAVLSSREMRNTRRGETYLSVEFADKTGRIPGVWFRPGATRDALPARSIVRVQGTVTSYRGTKRVSVDHMAEARQYDPEDLMASSSANMEEMLREFKRIASRVRSTGLRAVLKAVFGDEVFLSRFARCPGAQSYHHAYVGGLLEHTLAVARITVSLADLYPGVDRDLLLTAALLHDIGKVDELEWDTEIRFTDDGRLLGHVVLGERRVRDAVERGRIDLTREQAGRLSHAILAHHGELEWGAPKRPATLESLVLHHADNLDAKVAGFGEVLAGASALDERWTDADNLFRRPLFSPSAAEDDRRRRPAEDDQYVRATA